MIHVGTAAYYEAVRAKLEACSVVLFEGVGSPAARTLATAYTLAARRRRLGLVTQRAALPLRSLGKELVHADLRAKEFKARWSTIPWHERLPLLLGAPVYGAWLYLTATRESIGRHLQTEDVSSRDDVLRGESAPGIEDALLTRRDSRLVATIAALLAQPGRDSPVAIVYGAGHMRVVTRFLIDEYQYRVAESEWVTVFSYDS
jgi:pheromone shutdown protein TraB